MDIDNTTAVPVKATVYAPPVGERTAIFTAKATFAFTDAGEVQLDRNDPFPVQDEDVDTELGILPSDALPRVDPVFEVMVLGRAYPPRGKPAPWCRVTLAVGEERRELVVFGDRIWEGQGPQARASEPVPFESMPLTWDRAFGGKRDVLIDLESPVEVSEPNNPAGRGFDHIAQARALGEMFRPPEPYPQFDPLRELPNVELPDALIQRWEDSPLPACWAPTPLSSALVVERLRRAQRREPAMPVTITSPEVMHRAHPDWVISMPPEGAPVEMEGLLPVGPVRFALPSLRLVLDLRVGEDEHSLELVPRSLVLLPEERRFYLVYRQFATYPYDPESSRTARVRVEPGWTTA